MLHPYIDALWRLRSRHGFTASDVEMFASGPVHIVVDNPEYDKDVVLTPDQHAELLSDLHDKS